MTHREKIRKGRPPKHDETMLEPITIRLTKAIADRIEGFRGRLDHKDKATIVRELIAEAIEARDMSARK